MKNYSPYLIILAALLWSLDGLLRRELYSLPPAVLVFLEHLLGLIVILPILFVRRRGTIKTPPRETPPRGVSTISFKTWLSVIAIAFFASTVATIAYTTALGKVNYISLSIVVLLQQLQPIFAVALAALWLREPITKKFVALAVLALAAAYFVSFPNLRVNWDTGKGTVIAALLALLAAFSWGAATVWGRYALAKLSFIALTGLRFALTVLFIFIFIAGTGKLGVIVAVTARQWWYIIAIVFSTGLVALLIYYKGLSRVPARVATILEMFWPVSAVAIDWFFFDKTLSATQWLGAIILLAVIVKLSRDFSKRDIVPLGPE